MSRVNIRNNRSPLLRKAVFDGYHFGLLLSPIDNVSTFMSSREGQCIRKTGHPFQRYWRLPKLRVLNETRELYDDLVLQAAGRHHESWEAFREKLQLSQQAIHPAAFVWGCRYRIAPLSEGGVLLSGDYHPGIVSVARSMRGTFLAATASWKIPADGQLLQSNLVSTLGLAEDQFDMMAVVQELHSDGSVSVADDMPRIRIGGPPAERLVSKDDEDGEAGIYLAAVPTIFNTEYSEAVVDGLMKSFSLMDHQPEGIKHLLRRSSALLADDMGLGKSRQAVIAAGIQSRGKPILVVVLASLIVNWTREIFAVYPQATVAQQCFDPEAQWIVVNYERLGDFISLAPHFSVMIIDEAHRLKEPTAMWTRHGFDIAAQIPNRYLLTGTPILNRESELHTLLRLSGHPVGALPLKEFAGKYAGNSEFRSCLRAEISDWMLRRSKDVLPGLKGKQRQVHTLALSAQERESYERIRMSEQQPLARLGALRQLLEAAKISYAVELLEGLNSDDKIIIFCEYKDTVRALKECCIERNLECVSLVGTDSAAKRQNAIDKFQAEAGTRVFIGTTRAAGTGINLTAANYVAFLGLPWTPGQQDQAEDRAYRNGQLRAVLVKIPLAENTIDHDLWFMLQAKRKVSSELIDGVDAERMNQSTLAQKLTSVAPVNAQATC